MLIQLVQMLLVVGNLLLQLLKLLLLFLTNVEVLIGLLALAEGVAVYIEMDQLLDNVTVLGCPNTMTAARTSTYL